MSDDEEKAINNHGPPCPECEKRMMPVIKGGNVEKWVCGCGREIFVERDPNWLYKCRGGPP